MTGWTRWVLAAMVTIGLAGCAAPTGANDQRVTENVDRVYRQCLEVNLNRRFRQGGYLLSDKTLMAEAKQDCAPIRDLAEITIRIHFEAVYAKPSTFKTALRNWEEIFDRELKDALVRARADLAKQAVD